MTDLDKHGSSSEAGTLLGMVRVIRAIWTHFSYALALLASIHTNRWVITIAIDYVEVSLPACRMNVHAWGA